MSNYRITVRAIVIHDSKILLNEFDNGTYYNLPGGGLEVGETLKACVEREVLEESGYKIDVGEMMYIYEYNPERDQFKFGSRGALSHVFRCHIDMAYDRQERTVIDSDPKNGSISTGCKWIPVNELRNINLIPQINEKLMDDLSKAIYRTQFLENIH